MASDLNVIVLVGRLTKDPELRHTPSGTAVCNLRVAYSRRIKQGDEWLDKSCYIDVTVWGRRGETVAQHLSKGRRIGVKGELDWREWDANDGSKRQAYEIIADDVQFLDSAKDGQGGGSGSGSGGGGGEDFGASASTGEDFGPTSTGDDDIPF